MPSPALASVSAVGRQRAMSAAKPGASGQDDNIGPRPPPFDQGHRAAQGGEVDPLAPSDQWLGPCQTAARRPEARQAPASARQAARPSRQSHPRFPHERRRFSADRSPATHPRFAGWSAWPEPAPGRAPKGPTSRPALAKATASAVPKPPAPMMPIMPWPPSCPTQAAPARCRPRASAGARQSRSRREYRPAPAQSPPKRSSQRCQYKAAKGVPEREQPPAPKQSLTWLEWRCSQPRRQPRSQRVKAHQTGHSGPNHVKAKNHQHHPNKGPGLIAEQ